jgi:glycosyltransferase involved in cell wall biosynthesis
MNVSSPRFKAIAVSAGFSFWFFIISSSMGIFTIEYFAIFVISIFSITQILSVKVSKVLDAFAIFNTKIFLGIFFIILISGYGVFFKFLGIDLLRLKIKKKQESYWLDIKQLNDERIFKQY